MTAAVVLLHKFASQSLVLAVKDGRRLFVVLALLVFADDSFLFNHSLETFDCLFQVLIVVNIDCCHVVSHRPFRAKFRR